MINEPDQYLELPMMSSYISLSGICCSLRVLVWALAWERVPRVGLSPGGREAGRAWCQGGLASGIGSFWEGWIWEMAVRICD